MTYGEKLKAIRKSKKISAQTVADKISIAQSSLSNLENNQAKINIDTLGLILSVYGMTLEQFFSETNNESLEYVELTSELKRLNTEQLKILTILIRNFLNDQTVI